MLPILPEAETGTVKKEKREETAIRVAIIAFNGFVSIRLTAGIRRATSFDICQTGFGVRNSFAI